MDNGASQTPPASTGGSRPHKVRKTRRHDDTASTPYNAEEPTLAQPVLSLAKDDVTSTAAEPRSCENCRRSKLKCSRFHPCRHCDSKSIVCVYEQPDKKRGPRPGYIEEIYRRIDTLEHMFLGQSLAFNRQVHTQADDPETLHLVTEAERTRLIEAGRRLLEQDEEPAEGEDKQNDNGFVVTTLSPTTRDGQLSEAQSSMITQRRRPVQPSQHLLEQICEAHRHQIQPWIPVLCLRAIELKCSSYDMAKPLGPVLQAVVTASSPFVLGNDIDTSRLWVTLCDDIPRQIFRSADMDHLQAAVILQFLLFGKGSITDHWGFVAFLPQLALRLGLNLEDQHLTAEHREYRSLVRFDERGTSWGWKESVRRLFWAIFMQDQLASIFSGTRPSIAPADIRRLLPCDGQRWIDDDPVHTRQFVPANVAVQVQVFPDSNIGGFAYVIEATEILGLASEFALKVQRSANDSQDARSFLQEFLSLDLILTSWKARLPLRYQRASYDDSGYMDHNITLAHVTHNTSSIMLYQAARAIAGLGLDVFHLPSSLFPQTGYVKQAAKEIANICTRFLLHRRYLVSPHLAYCQFIAAKSLLSYSCWFSEPLDKDFETLHAALGESAKRWDGIRSTHERNIDIADLDNLAAQLYTQLGKDSKAPHRVNLTAPITKLLRERGKPGTMGVNSKQQVQERPTEDVDREGGRDNDSEEMVSSVNVAASATAPELGVSFPNMFHFQGRQDGDMSVTQVTSAESETMYNRIFSWQDYGSME